MNDMILSQYADAIWVGELELRFSFREGRSVLNTCKHSGPFVVQRGFYSKEDNVLHVYLLHPAGGLVGGDKLVLNVHLEPNSQVLLTNSSASKFYRTNGLYASQINIFKIADNAVLEWVPQTTIFFPQSNAMINTTFVLGSGARLIAFDMLCFSNVMLNFGFNPKEINIFLSINLLNSVGLKERLQLNKTNYIVKLGGFKISAILLAVPSNQKILCQVRKVIAKETIDNTFQIGGVTLLDDLLVVRLLGNDNQSVKKLLYHIWSVIRPIIIGKNVVIPRIWNT